MSDVLSLSKARQEKKKLLGEVNPDGDIPTTDDKTVEELKAELEEFKVQSALAQAEAYEKQEQDKLLVMAAIAEAYELGLSGGIE